MDYNIYKDIAERTGGDIYIGVVGPVRTGKSTFIKRFMDTLVLPHIGDGNKRARAVDELPQSADGKTIMTTEPKFVPNEAVTLNIEKTVADIRLIDCVGYLVDGAIGHMEGDKPRLVHTPWSSEEMPFQAAAELGTEKVIKEHSTVGVLVTTDGSVTELKREQYVSAEERVVSELKALKKPFVIALNTKKPTSAASVKLVAELTEKYGVTTVPINVAEASAEELGNVMVKIIMEFPVKAIDIDLPRWMRALPKHHPIIKEILTAFLSGAECKLMRDYEKLSKLFENSEYLLPDPDMEVMSGVGVIRLSYRAPDGLFYKVLASECGTDIDDDYKLMRFALEATRAQKDFGKIRSAMLSVDENGYGIVTPDISEMKLEAPELVKKGSQFGIKLTASAPSYHLVKVDVQTEVSPTIGSEQQSEELIKNLLTEYASNVEGLWETNMFGRPLSALVKEDIAAKINAMPRDTQKKLRRTMSRIVNENKGGILCILI